MTVTQHDTTETETETVNYAEERFERFRGEGAKIHAVAEEQDETVKTRCGWTATRYDVRIHEERPENLSGNTICYDCVRAGDAEVSR